MSTRGDSSDRSLLHDLLLDAQHQIDKALLENRKNYEFLRIPTDRSFEFLNDFGVLAKQEFYFRGNDIPEVSGKWIDPPEWDRSGTCSSYSAHSDFSDVLAYQEKKRTDHDQKSLSPIAPKIGPPPAAGKSEPVDAVAYFEWLVGIRNRTRYFQRYQVKKEKGYWSNEPVYVARKRVKGEKRTDAELEEDGADKMMQEASKIVEIPEPPVAPSKKRATGEKGSKNRIVKKLDLRRLTINSHPGLSRAMALALGDNVSPEIIAGALRACVPKLNQDFFRVTGRLVAGTSIHVDTNLAHWNLWSHGLEKVICEHEGRKYERYRRTRFSLNSSGNMLAWDRVERLFAKFGDDFAAVAPEKAENLRKGESRAGTRQDRPAGDIELNRLADEFLESALSEAGLKKYIDLGYREFYEHEKLRYGSGFAAKGLNAKKLAERKIALNQELTDLEGLKRVKDKLESLPSERKGAGAEEILDGLLEKSWKVGDLERNVAQLQDENLILKNANESLVSQLAVVESEKQVITAEIESVMSEVPECSGQSAMLIDRIRNLSGVLLGKNFYIEALKGQKALLENRINSAMREIQAIVSENSWTILKPFEKFLSRVCAALGEVLPKMSVSEPPQPKRDRPKFEDPEQT